MIGLYLHIPFCLRKCPYCDFFSLVGRDGRSAEYVGAMGAQMALFRRDRPDPGPIATVFFGGGTPSLLTPAVVDEILTAADRLWGLTTDAEISLEANPGTLSRDKLEGYRRAGINRLSLGVQTFSSPFLEILGRLHTLADVEAGWSQARQAGFRNIGMDLIFGLPGQTLEDWLRDLEQALAHGPEHLSLYGLTLEEGTEFARLHRAGKLRLPDEDITAAMFFEAHRLLEARGYAHYEISNYARSGFPCRHNQIYWRRGACLGVGAGAHSFFARSWGERWAAPPDLDQYCAALAQGLNPACLIEDFSREKAMAETLYLGLRTADGVCEADFKRFFGAGVEEAFPQAVKRLANDLVLVDGCWRMPWESWLIYDHLIQRFL
jgi:oxygen-independent coproporphyrinogen-3 oxidase